MLGIDVFFLPQKRQGTVRLYISYFFLSCRKKKRKEGHLFPSLDFSSKSGRKKKKQDGKKKASFLPSFFPLRAGISRGKKEGKKKAPSFCLLFTALFIRVFNCFLNKRRQEKEGRKKAFFLPSFSRAKFSLEAENAPNFSSPKAEIFLTFSATRSFFSLKFVCKP